MLWHGKNFRGIINKAKEMIFDNTGTDLISTNAEDAIKEVSSNLNNIVDSGILTSNNIALDTNGYGEWALAVTIPTGKHMLCTLEGNSNPNAVIEILGGYTTGYMRFLCKTIDGTPLANQNIILNAHYIIA